MMYIHSNWSTVVGYFRPSRKCFSFNGSLLLLLIFVVASIRTSLAISILADDLPHDFNVGEFRDVDNLEIHNVKLVNGVPQEDHPIIIYKEDFVSEDYVPPKNETKSERHKRRYKDIAHRRHHFKQNLTDEVIEEKPEKMLFDIIPEKPLNVDEEMDKHKRSHIELVPLIDDLSVGGEEIETEGEEENTKEELRKRPKKYHRRVRRSANGEHVVLKRNPYYRQTPKVSGEVSSQVQYIYVKHSVPGKKHNGLDIPVAAPKPRPSTRPTPGPMEPISFDNRVAADENDRVIFSGGRGTPKRPTRPTRPTPAPTESIFRDPRPDNFDYSFMNPSANSRPATTKPPTFQAAESIFRDPRPENFDYSFMNNRQDNGKNNRLPTASPQSNVQQSAPSQPSPPSQCVWAIVNCCLNRNSDIRYSCFEQHNCHGAFWDLNPCADNVRDTFVNYVADYYN